MTAEAFEFETWHEQLPRIHRLWVDLSRAQHAVKEGEDLLKRLSIPPWISDDPQVKEAWLRLTDPENLADLETWAHRELNPTAAEYTKKALADCRARTRTETR
jgi:hypothetical protein